MSEMQQSDDNKSIPITSVWEGQEREERVDLFYYTIQIVNVIFIGNPRQGKWVLVDAGMPKSGSRIISAAEKRFGKDNKPEAIILTHGHFDHVGGIVEILEHWDVPVFAHYKEFPFLTGKENYSVPDTSTEGRLLAKISSVYPHEPVNISKALQPLPEDHTVPALDDWQWVHTPGHSPGHISLFRERDKSLISGDAFVTVRQDSMYKVLIQDKEINGPPRYLTTDWQAAWESVRKLEALQPALVIPGHGSALEGEELTEGLKELADEFDQIAIPDFGKYVNEDKG
ncbi:MAG: MBL fold metallo-hydrolase [Bacteroidia bacterium]